MSIKKIEQCLSLAFNNSSKAEATTAFGQAFAWAQREGVNLADFRGKGTERVIYQDRGCSPEREQELVDKYNAVLARAKDMVRQLAEAQDIKEIQNLLMQDKDTQIARLKRELENERRRSVKLEDENRDLKRQHAGA